MVPSIPRTRANLRLRRPVPIDSPELRVRNTTLLVRQLLPIVLESDVAGVEVLARAERLEVSAAEIVAGLPGDFGDGEGTRVADEDEVAVAG